MAIALPVVVEQGQELVAGPRRLGGSPGAVGLPRPGARRRRPIARHPLLGARERGGDAHVVERLEQVVDRVDLEGAHGVGVVGGHEHGGRQRLGAQRLQHLEAVDLRHLHVEEHQLDPRALDQRRGVDADAVADHGDLGIGLQDGPQRRAGERLVVDDRRADRRPHGARGGAPAASLHGKLTAATTPPASARSSNCWSPR